MLSTGETQTFSTPSTGASHEIKRPSGDNFAPKNVGLSNSFRRGIKGRADIFGSLSYLFMAERDRLTSRALLGQPEWKITTSFASRHIACRCKGRHERRSAYIALSLPGTSRTCPPSRWNREYTRLRTRCMCEGSQPSSLPSCIYKSALHRSCHSGRPSCRRTPA